MWKKPSKNPAQSTGGNLEMGRQPSRTKYIVFGAKGAKWMGQTTPVAHHQMGLGTGRLASTRSTKGPINKMESIYLVAAWPTLTRLLLLRSISVSSFVDSS